MKYRLAGATYRVIAEKLTEERAQVYADANGISIDRAMKKIQPVSIKTAWEDVMAEMEDLRRETELQRADLMALENARLDQLFSKSLSLFSKGSVPAGRLAIATMGRAEAGTRAPSSASLPRAVVPDGRGVVRASWLTDLGALWGPLEGDDSAGDVAVRGGQAAACVLPVATAPLDEGPD